MYLCVKIKDMKLKEISSDLLSDYRDNNISFEELAVKLKVSRQTLTNYFKQNKIDTNKALKRKNIKHDYFDDINTPIKAYLLGYYIADGCCILQKGKYTTNKSIKFACTEADIEILHLVKKELGLTNKITISKSYKVKNTNYISKPMASISVVSSNIFETLTKYNLGQNKTYNSYYIPKIDNNLIIYLILGYFDGDGCLSISKGIKNNGYKYHNFQFSFTCHNVNFLKDIQKYFKTINIESFIRKTKNSYILDISKRKDILKIKELFYLNDLNLGLNRKKVKFMEIPC